jgi:hypothetical protein
MSIIWFYLSTKKYFIFVHLEISVCKNVENLTRNYKSVEVQFQVCLASFTCGKNKRHLNIMSFEKNLFRVLCRYDIFTKRIAFFKLFKWKIYLIWKPYFDQFTSYNHLSKPSWVHNYLRICKDKSIVCGKSRSY